MQLITGEMKKFEVLVKVVACGISADDCIPVLTGVHVDDGCQQLGTDISGIVHCVGAEVKTLRIGDRVAGTYLILCFHLLLAIILCSRVALGWIT